MFHPFSHVRSLLAAVMLVLGQGITAAPPPIALDIRYLSGNAPFTTRARTTVEPHEANRMLCLAWSNMQTGESRTSCQELQATEEPRTFWQDLKDLSSGKWDVVAVLIRNDNSRYTSTHFTLHVFGPNYQSDPTE